MFLAQTWVTGPDVFLVQTWVPYSTTRVPSPDACSWSSTCVHIPAHVFLAQICVPIPAYVFLAQTWVPSLSHVPSMQDLYNPSTELQNVSNPVPVTKN